MSKMLRSLTGVVILLLVGLACNLPRITGNTANGTNRGPTNTDGAETIRIPGGMFQMGSQPDDLLAGEDEMPRHQVTLDSFYIYTHEVTNKMYADCVETGGCISVDALESGPTSHYGDSAFADHPVTGVDWLMARDYCTWAGGRLPTEAEWELATRSTDSFRYPWGEDEPTCDRANMLGCSVPPDTLAVGSLAPGNSAYEVWDLSGNVWEWVNDWYDEDYYFFSPASNPLGPNLGERETKVVRGGGLYSEPTMMRGAARQSAEPHRPYDDVGFRCVALSDLALPEDYVPVDPGHLRVPPDSLDGGGEHVEDPDDPRPGWARFGEWVASCPTEDGRLSVDLGLSYSCEDTSYTATVGGIPYSCVYDPAREVLHCEGDLPPDIAAGEAVGGILRMQCGGSSYSFGGIVSLPDDCGGGRPPGLFALLNCPVERMVTITIGSVNEVTYDRVRQDTGSGEVDLPCGPTVTSGGTRRITCTALDVLVEGAYLLHVWGTEAGRPDFEVSNWHVWPLLDCPAEEMDVTVTPQCFEDHMTAQVMYSPSSSVLESVSTGGTELDCIGMAPGVQICGDLPGPAGSTATVTTCFEGEACTDWPVTVFACPGTAPGRGYLINPTCYPPGAAGVSLRYWPFDLPLVDANANGTWLTCDNLGGGFYLCSGLPGAVGEVKTITFCLEGYDCFGGDITVPACGGEVPSGDWTISGYGCHDETSIYFMVDTGLDWLVPGAAYTYSASDEEGSYSCSLIPTVPGRMYCSGPRPETPGTLQVCVHPDGGSLTCNYFDTFPGLVAAIPSCAPEEPPPDTGPSCSAYTDGPACQANGCVWTKGPPDGHEHCYTPPGP